jgi:hypothetical protein
MRALLFILSLAGCTDCPGEIPSGDCSAVGAQSCNYGEYDCSCVNGKWVCGGGPDIGAPVDLARRD